MQPVEQLIKNFAYLATRQANMEHSQHERTFVFQAPSRRAFGSGGSDVQLVRENTSRYPHQECSAGGVPGGAEAGGASSLGCTQVN